LGSVREASSPDYCGPVAGTSPGPLLLLADGDADTRDFYAELFEVYGYRTEQADSGPDALAKAMLLRPAALVCETRLPVIDGYEVCRQLRRLPHTRDITIVIVAGDIRVERSEKEGADADAILLKPCLPELLLDAVRRGRCGGTTPR
jgi:CheY-like chemotaxis protein